MVAGNLIGTINGYEPDEQRDGVLIESGAQSNIIGTNGDGKGDADERNVISGNQIRAWISAGPGPISTWSPAT